MVGWGLHISLAFLCVGGVLLNCLGNFTGVQTFFGHELAATSGFRVSETHLSGLDFEMLTWISAIGTTGPFWCAYNVCASNNGGTLSKSWGGARNFDA